ncbi:hypothetical protein GIX45_25160 [Erwinia sp. CPCC 100877]|nr:hypothetical protein [Erwinia sp. CPCC 100877]
MAAFVSQINEKQKGCIIRSCNEQKDIKISQKMKAFYFERLVKCDWRPHYLMIYFRRIYK